MIPQPLPTGPTPKSPGPSIDPQLLEDPDTLNFLRELKFLRLSDNDSDSDSPSHAAVTAALKKFSQDLLRKGQMKREPRRLESMSNLSKADLEGIATSSWSDSDSPWKWFGTGSVGYYRREA